VTIDYFSTIARIIKEKSIPLKSFICSKLKYSFPKTYSKFRFQEVRVNVVFNYLKELSRKKAYGHDGLPPGMLKDSAISYRCEATYARYKFHA